MPVVIMVCFSVALVVLSLALVQQVRQRRAYQALLRQVVSQHQEQRDA